MVADAKALPRRPPSQRLQVEVLLIPLQAIERVKDRGADIARQSAQVLLRSLRQLDGHI